MEKVMIHLKLIHLKVIIHFDSFKTVIHLKVIIHLNL